MPRNKANKVARPPRKRNPHVVAARQRGHKVHMARRTRREVDDTLEQLEDAYNKDDEESPSN